MIDEQPKHQSQAGAQAPFAARLAAAWRLLFHPGRAELVPTPSLTKATAPPHTPTPDAEATRERLIKVFHASPSMIAISTVEDGVHLEVNQAWLDALGYDRDRVIGYTAREIGVWAHFEDRGRFIAELHETGGVRNFESQFRTSNGDLKDVMISAEVLQSEEPAAMVIIGHDITERKLADRELLKSKIEAERANSAKTRLLANVSHQLRTPLNAIIGFSELLMKETWGRLGDPRYRDYAEDIYGSGTGLLDIINDLIDIARVEAGYVTFRTSHFDLGRMLRKSVARFADQVKASGIVLHGTFEDGLEVECDQGRLRQIVGSLISNAVKFTDDGGEIWLESRREGENCFVIVVRDTGVGISQEDLDLVFSPFGTLDNESLTARTGAGLGLPLARALADAMGGNLRFRSSLGEGTEAAICLLLSPGLPCE